MRCRPRSASPFASLEPGDVLFFGSKGPRSKPAQIYHAGIYLGGGWMIHSTGTGVSLAPITTGYYVTSFAWGRRPLAEAGLENAVRVPRVIALGVLALASLAGWIGVLAGTARAWDLRPIAEDEPQPPEPERWPSVAVLVPARNEADVLPETLPALLAQDYPGAWHLVLVDDRSTDGTAAARTSVRCRAGAGHGTAATAGSARSGRSSRRRRAAGDARLLPADRRGHPARAGLAAAARRRERGGRPRR